MQLLDLLLILCVTIPEIRKRPNRQYHRLLEQMKPLIEAVFLVTEESDIPLSMFVVAASPKRSSEK